MTISSLDNDEITGLYALTGFVAVYALAGVLEAHLKIILELLLAHTCKPVIDLQLTAALTIGAVKFSCFLALYNTSTRAIIFL